MRRRRCLLAGSLLALALSAPAHARALEPGEAVLLGAAGDNSLPPDAISPIEPSEPPDTIEVLKEREQQDEEKARQAPEPKAPPVVESTSNPEELPEPGRLSEEQREQVLEHPTRSIEEYQRVRAAELHRRSLPDWGIGLIIAPHAFRQADLRAPTGGGFDQSNPSLFGVALSYEHSVLKAPGILLLGLDFGTYSSTISDPWKGLTLGVLTANPHVAYEGIFLQKQWVVPTARLGYEQVRYSYSFQNHSVQGFKQLPRLDLGALIYLNLLEPASAAEMSGDYGIKRTYLGAYYTIINDSSKQDFNMSDHAFRVVLRFEH